MQNDYICLII